MPGGLSYAGSRAGVRRSRRPRRGSRSSSGASLEWRAGWTDPVITLTPGVTGAIQVLGPNDLDQFENTSVVGGFVQVAGYVFNAASTTDGAAGHLIMGMRTQVNTIVDIAEMPDPYNENSGDWFWYRSFPLLDEFGRGVYDGCNSFSVNDQIKSARRLAEDDEVNLSYTWLDADLAAGDAYCRLLVSWRLLLRIP